MMRISKPMLIAFGAALLTLSLPSFAAPFNVTDTVTFNGTSYSVTPSGMPSNGTISPTISYSIGNAFNGAGQMATGANFNAAATGLGGPWNFQDDYFFSTTGATVQTAVISTALNAVSNLQVRLIYAAGNTTVAQLLGTPASGTKVDSWQDFTLFGTSYNVTLPTGFAAGDYIMQIRGEVAGPGGYGGSIAFTEIPVPLPAALPLLLMGLSGLGLFRKRTS